MKVKVVCRKFECREDIHLGLIMYIFTTLEFSTHNFDFHLLTTSVNAKYCYDEIIAVLQGSSSFFTVLLQACMLRIHLVDNRRDFYV